MDNVCGKDLFSPDMVPLNMIRQSVLTVTPKRRTTAERTFARQRCMVPLDPYTSPLLQIVARLILIIFLSAGALLFFLVDEHPPSVCPYRKRVPKNATVGSGGDIVCSVCHRFFRGSCCGQDAFKVCCICGKIGDHWSTVCPSPLRQEKDISFNNDLHSYYPVNKESLAPQ